MSALRAFMETHRAFEVPTQFGLAGDAGRSLICFHNFYSELFRDTDTPVDLHLFGFDAAGNEARSLAVPLATGEAAQVPIEELGMREPALVAVAAVPRFDLYRMAQDKFKVRARISTGFYMIWQDPAGHMDTMHEWLTAGPAPLPARNSYVVFQSAGGRITRCGLVLTSPSLDATAAAEVQLSLYQRSGRTLASAEVQRLPPMGARLLLLDEVFAGFAKLLSEEGTLGVRIRSRNLAEPLSFEQRASGDFHIQHL